MLPRGRGRLARLSGSFSTDLYQRREILFTTELDPAETLFRIEVADRQRSGHARLAIAPELLACGSPTPASCLYRTELWLRNVDPGGGTVELDVVVAAGSQAGSPVTDSIAPAIEPGEYTNRVAGVVS